nr:DUF2920 family protein [Phenylobacterium sp.]
MAGIVDNSGYVQPPISYLGIGSRAEYLHNHNGVVLMCHVDGAWSYNHRRDRNFYDRNRDLIRDTGYVRHLQIMAANAQDSQLAITMVNATNDEVTAPDEKERQAARLNAAGVPTKLQLVQAQDIDGVLFREHAHSLGLSLKRLFTRDIVWLREAGARGSSRWGGSVDYPCVDTGYRFGLTSAAPYVTGEVFELF